MPKSKLSKHFNSLLAQNQEEEALKQVRAMVQNLPDLQTRSSINLLLMGEPIPWERVLERLEQAIGKLNQEQSREFKAVIGKNNVDLSNIFGSNITIYKGSSTAPTTYLYSLEHHRAEGPVIGRKETLQALEALVQSADNRPIVIWGAKGAGKTLLAELFWEKHKNSYAAVGWLNFRKEGMVNTLILEISSVDSSQINPKKYEKEQLETHARFKIVNELQNRAGKKLLIMDNVPADSDVHKYLDWFRIADLQLIITAHEPMDQTQAFALPTLREEDIVALFKALSGQDADKETLALLTKLDQNPLLTRLIARNVPHEDLREATEWIKALGKALQEPSEGLTPEQSLLWALLERSIQAPEQQWLLLQLAAMPAVGFDLETLAGLILPEGGDLEDAAGWQAYLEDIQVVASGLDMETALEQLSDSAWLEFKEEEWWLPDAVREIIQKCYRSHSSYFKDLIESIRLSYFDEYGYIKGNALFISHLKGILPFLEYGETYLILHRLLIKTYNDLVNYYEEEKELIQLLEVVEKREGQQSEWFWEVTNDLSHCCRRTGHMAAADHFSRLQLEVAQHMYASHPRLGIAQNERGLVLLDLKDYGHAFQLLKQAIQSDLRNYGEQHPNVAKSQSNLALVYHSLGDYSSAVQQFEKALVLAEHNFGGQHPDVALIQANLAMSYNDLGDYTRSIELLEKALKSDLNNFGIEYPEVARKLSNLGMVYRNLGDYGRAAQLIEQALESDLRTFGAQHPKVAIRRSNLALVYRDLGDFPFAAQLFEQALKSDLCTFGAQNPTVATRQLNLGQVYSHLNRLEESKTLLEQALQAFATKLSKEHPDYISTLSWLEAVNKKLAANTKDK